MSKTLFTPGPWEPQLCREDFSQTSHYIIALEADECVAKCTMDYDADMEECEANARLIAAAPSMYELLVEIFEEVGLPEPQLSRYRSLLQTINP